MPVGKDNVISAENKSWVVAEGILSDPIAYPGPLPSRCGSREGKIPRVFEPSSAEIARQSSG